MVRLLSAAALVLAVASVGCQSAPKTCCNSCAGAPAMAQQPTPAEGSEQATAQVQANRRYSYSPDGSATSNGSSFNRSRAAQPSSNAPAWRADRKVVGF
ncbi:MAG TPA: hypothetical protein VHB99_17715 [Pirellulales bacterium]|nr:hypothetical protein [Pirellulales bacterium]